MAAKIYKRTNANGTTVYTTVVSLPRNSTGKSKQIRITKTKLREVERERTRILAAYENGEYSEAGNKRQTVAAYLQDWLKQASANLRPASTGRYEEIIRLHITPVLGKVVLNKLTAQQVSRLYASLLERLSKSTVSNVHTVLHKALDQAMKWDLVSQNVTDKVDPPSKGKPEHHTWNDEQVRAFLRAADSDAYAALWWLAVYSGMRRGELLGLKWQDVDIDGASITIKHTYSRGVGNKYELGSTKTQSGRRTVTLPGQVLSRLKAHHTRQSDARLHLGDDYIDRGFVFADEVGRPIHPNTLTHHFHKIIAAAGLPRIRIHDLRHGHATELMEAGVHPKVVSERLGHSNTRITMDLYSHVSPTMQRQVSEMLEKRIGPDE